MTGNSRDSITKEFKIFGKYIFEEFEQNISGIRSILNQTESSKTSVALKFLEDSLTLFESPVATVRDIYKRGRSEIQDSRNLVKTTKLTKLVEAWDEDEDEEMRKTLAKATLELYTSFYTTIKSVTTKQSDKHALKILARAAVKNFITWYLNQPEEKPFSIETITTGVTSNVKASSIFDHNKLMVYDKETKIEYNAIKLFTKSGLVVNDGRNSLPNLKYYVKQSQHSSKYGYRYLFNYEIENKTEILKRYVAIQEPNMKNKWMKPELDMEIWRELLDVIKHEDPKQIELRLKEHMEQTMTSIVGSLLSDFVEKIKNEFIVSTSNDTSYSVPDTRMPFDNIRARNVQITKNCDIESQTFTFH